MKTENIHLLNYSSDNSIYVIHTGINPHNSPCCNDCYMIVYVAHGSGTVQVNNEQLSISENDVFFIHPEVTYKFIPEHGLRRVDIYSCFFSINSIGNYTNFCEYFPEVYDLFNHKTDYIHAVDTDNKEIRDIFIRMIDEQHSNLPCWHDTLLGYLPVLLTQVFRNIKTRSFKRIYSNNRTVDETIRHINKRMYSKVSLNDIAQHLKVSPSFICRQFKKHTGMTTSQFINFLRVNKIKDILKNTDKPISAVPEMFSCNIEYLKSVFKKETGMTMQEYRNTYNYKYNPSDKKPPTV